MPTAFILINTELGSETNVVNDLKKIRGVEEAFKLYGTYGIIAKVKADTIDKLREILTQNIRRLSAIRSTLTLMSIEEK